LRDSLKLKEVKTLKISVNEKALSIVFELIKKSVELRVDVIKTSQGATLIDAGVNAPGSYEAGRLITEICLGGLGSTFISHLDYGGIILPTIHVEAHHPSISTLGSQFAGWRIKTEKYFGMGSGPARALALKPKELYEEIGYKDEYEKAIIVIESDSLPTDDVLEKISSECNVETKNVYAIITPTASIAGSVQISGRIVETGIHKLHEIGIDPKLILHAIGYAPIPPIHPKSAEAMGRTNDALYYGGFTFFTIDFEDEKALKELIKKAPSSASKDYGKPFYEIFKDANFDFYKIDPSLFAPAVVVVNNVKTGNTFKAGSFNPKILARTIGLINL
jgi:methenyltetrahydromethanopterin cyclohydrolase